MKKVLKIIILCTSAIIFIMVAIIVRLYMVRGYDYSLQKRHVNELTSYYEKNHDSLDEGTFLDFDLTDENIRLNDVQYLATHNSYKKTGPAIGRFFIGLGDSFEEARALKYGYKNITEQLQLGIRSFELDLRYRKDTFEITHVPLVDASSQAVNFELLLDELLLFSNHQENHMPILVLIELKNDWMILDPLLKDIDQQALIKLDDMIKSKLEDKLFLPSNMVDEHTSLKEKIMNDGWPLVSQLANKFIFILHPGAFEQVYYDIDQTLQTQSMFIGSSYGQSYNDYASFFVHNDVDKEIISQLISDNFMVRTRIDSNLIFSQDRFQSAIESGAQILTTDFSIGRSDINLDDVIYLGDHKLIVKRDSH